MHKRILLAFDASPNSERALQRVVEMAQEKIEKPEIIVVTVLQPVAAGVRFSSPLPLDTDEQKQKLAEAVTRLAERGIQAEEVLVIGQAVDAIVEVAREKQVDLIVMGTRGYTLAQRTLLGSVSRSVLYHAHCDVLVVR